MTELNRYSTLVAWAKVILPVVGILLLSSLFLFSRSPDPEAALPFADVDVAELAREQRLSSPRVAGTYEDGREVILVADAARPAAEASSILLLESVEARIELSETDLLFINAQDASVDMAVQMADLVGTVRLRSTQALRLESELLRVDLAELRLTSPGAVSVYGQGFTIEAGAMELEAPTEQVVVSFTDGVRVLYQR